MSSSRVALLRRRGRGTGSGSLIAHSPALVHPVAFGCVRSSWCKESREPQRGMALLSNGVGPLSQECGPSRRDSQAVAEGT